MTLYESVIILLARNRNALERDIPKIAVLENPLLLSGRNIIGVRSTLEDVESTFGRLFIKFVAQHVSSFINLAKM